MARLQVAVGATVHDHCSSLLASIYCTHDSNPAQLQLQQMLLLLLSNFSRPIR